jgi:hypothetical protein
LGEYYTFQANKPKQGDAAYEENEEFLNLTPDEQLIVRNQMHAAHRNWTWFHLITQISNEVHQTTATRRMGLSDSTLNMLLSLAQHAASMINRSKKEEDSREVQGAFLESLRFPPAASSPPTTSPKTLRKRLEKGFAIKKQFDYEKQVFSRKCDAVQIYDRFLSESSGLKDLDLLPQYRLTRSASNKTLLNPSLSRTIQVVPPASASTATNQDTLQRIVTSACATLVLANSLKAQPPNNSRTSR